MNESLTAFMLLKNSGIDDSRRLSILASATPSVTSLSVDSATDEFIEAVTYETIAGTLWHCDKNEQYRETVSVMSLNRGSITTAPRREMRKFSPDAPKGLNLRCKSNTIGKYVHWAPDHCSDRALKDNLSSHDTPSRNEQFETNKVTMAFSSALITGSSPESPSVTLNSYLTNADESSRRIMHNSSRC